MIFRDGGVTLQNLQIAVDGGIVSADGRAGSTLELNIAAKAVPLSGSFQQQVDVL